MRLLFFGDVFGKAGRSILKEHLPTLKDELKPDFVIINGENLADGKGLTEKTLRPLLHAGVDAVTGGNHLWDRAESLDYIARTPLIVKPLNYPDSAPGSLSFTITKDQLSLTVISISGQVYMPACDSPFAAFDEWYDAKPKENRCILLDFHAESTAETRALGWHVDGRISAMIGTHTHIQTADEEILPLGTAYLTDAGMTGPHDSVIGMRKSIILQKFRTSVPIRYEASDKGNQINAVLVDIDPASGRAQSIQRIKRKVAITKVENNDS
ncbi:MAG: TIGR00282 family metallophosphoesterase [Candidatus Cloacimonetes bacterium]|nr:TIGR00282 family metallophosphoesterase [Candidatus Cloacimonadota bacterium]NLO11999.1 TIGR00282 family metallophosphoesterase [Candidatus Cloacimonadota bacterium]